MLTELLISLFISALLNAETTKPSSTPLLNIEEELANISTSCLSRRDHEEITGNTLRYWMASMVTIHLTSEAQYLIGTIELRAALGMPPHGPWKRKRILKEEDILAAPTIEEYYERREESLSISSWNLDNYKFFEKNFAPAIAFLDKRFPAIRGIYRQEFRNAKKLVDRKAVDSMLSKYHEVSLRIDGAVNEMQRNTIDCWGASAFPISTTATPESFDNETALFINETLTKIYNACVSFKDRAEMTGNTLKAKKNLMVTDFLLEVVPEIIGLYELRSVLGFAPPVSWAQRKSATNEELEAAPTIEAYYNLKEPFVYEYNPKGNMLIEKYLPTAVALLNKRIPEIRNVYRKYFEDKLGSLQGKIDRAGVDYMIKQYDDINSRVGDVIWILPIYNRSDCFFMEAEENTRTESDRKRFWKLIESIAEN